MKRLILISLILIPTILNPMNSLKQRAKKGHETVIRKHGGWTLKQRRRATQNAPDEMLRAQRRQQQEDQAQTRCLTSTKALIEIFGSIIAVGLSIATFVIAIVV